MNLGTRLLGDKVEEGGEGDEKFPNLDDICPQAANIRWPLVFEKVHLG